MTDSVAEKILKDVETTLEGISTPTYEIDVHKVLAMNAGYPDLKEYPGIVLVWLESIVEDDLNRKATSLNNEMIQMRLDVWLETRDSVREEMTKASRDVRKALMVDPRRDGNALHTFIRRVVPFYNENLGDPYALVEIYVDVQFRTDVNDLNTPQ